MTTSTRTVKGPNCPNCPKVEMQHFTRNGRRWIYKCSDCGGMGYKPRPTPKRAKDLFLTSIPLSELDIQRRLFDEARSKEREWPELSLLHSIPNGAFVPPGERGKLVGTGMKPGVPDVCLPVARNGVHGLYIELKAPGEKPEPHQLHWHRALQAQGYAVAVCEGWQAAWNLILQYLAGE